MELYCDGIFVYTCILQARIVHREPRDEKNPPSFVFLENDITVQLNGLQLVYEKSTVQKLITYFMNAAARSALGLDVDEDEAATAKAKAEPMDWSRNRLEIEVCTSASPAWNV